MPTANRDFGYPWKVEDRRGQIDIMDRNGGTALDFGVLVALDSKSPMGLGYTRREILTELLRNTWLGRVLISTSVRVCRDVKHNGQWRATWTRGRKGLLLCRRETPFHAVIGVLHAAIAEHYRHADRARILLEEAHLLGLLPEDDHAPTE